MYPTSCWPRATMGLLIALGGSFVHAQAPATDPLERQMEFTDQSADATDLYNEGHYPEALAAFQSLVQLYADQDTDGYAALGLADTLAAMGRIDDARAAYAAVPAPDAQRQQAIRDRIEELELKAPINDQTLDRLRLAAQQPGDSGFTSAWRLGRALQKRSAELLAEAAQVFRTTGTASQIKFCAPAPRAAGSLSR